MAVLNHSLAVVDDEATVAHVRGHGVVASAGTRGHVLGGHDLLSAETGAAVRGHRGRPPRCGGRRMHLEAARVDIALVSL